MKLGINISQATVAKYMVRHPKPPSQTWKTFLANHASQLVSIDFFTVYTIWFEILFVFVALTHDRRRIVHFNVTAHPTAEWTAQQIVEAVPFDSAPKYLLRDRDRIYGFEFRKQVEDWHEPRLKVMNENVGTLVVSVILPVLTGSAARWVITRRRH